MAIARVDKFISKLKPLTRINDIKLLCNQELDYLRKELHIDTVYSEAGYPIGVKGDARRLKSQVSIYRKAISQLKTNSRNSFSIISNGYKENKHKALKYFNIENHEKRDVNSRDRARVKEDKTNRLSFKAIAVIDKALDLIESDSYVSKVAGLYLLTGRRHEEILITANFIKSDFDIDPQPLIRDWLEYDIESTLFSGQVKRKGKDDIPYNIPILAPLKTIQTVVDWLRLNKPHKSGQRPKGSKELGLKVRKEFEKTNLLPIPSGKESYLNPHNLRSAYCAISWQLFKYSDTSFNCTEDIFIKAIMGHLEETTQSAQSYLDYELNNIEIQKLVEKYYE